MSGPNEPHDPFPDFESAGPSEPHDPFPDIESAEPVEPMPKPKPAPPAPSKPTYAAKPSGPHKPSPIPAIVTAMGLGALLAGGGILLGQNLPKSEPAPAPAPTPAASTTPAPSPDAEAKPTADAALAGRVDGLGNEIKELGKRIDDIQKGLASLPKPEPGPAVDLKPIEAKIDAMSKRLDAASPPDLKGFEDQVTKATAAQAEAATKLGALASSVEGLEKALAAQKTELAAVQEKLKAAPEARPSTDTPAAGGAAAGNGTVSGAAAEADYNKAVGLFKANQFAQARDAFLKLGETCPNDARVWYYAAVANGYATNVWNGETERLVTKGVESEKGGTPDLAKINATFADLAPPSVKAWLDAYRARAR